MKILKTREKSFQKEFKKILERASDVPREVEKTVQKILEQVRRRGDSALFQYTRKFDRHSPRSLEVSRSEIRAAYQKIDKKSLDSLHLALRRIEKFHRRQATALRSWSLNDGGVSLGEQIRPVRRVGVYVPGGLAAYPSTVLMNIVPARLAGVKEMIMVSPWSGGRISPYTLVAADLAGATRIFKIGGAQGVAALAFGTKTIPAVDKIVGPGNIYVATAKRLVFGRVGIDMIAGPTEVLILADQSARADFVVADLLSQAEHDPRAIALLITPSERLASQVHSRLKEKGKILQRQCLVILTKNEEEAIDLTNAFAPEHLELQVKNPRKVAGKIFNAGAVFLGHDAPVAMGDYLAGPNHVLPTAGTARFFSPLGVVDFMKRSSLIEMSSKAIQKLGPHVVRLARLEGLKAHAASVAVRLKGKNS